MKQNFFVKHATSCIIIALLSLLVLLNFYSWIFEVRFEGDIASRMLLVLGPSLGFGSPYKDLWEIIPPGYILILQIWSAIFGGDILFFKILHLTITALTAVFLFLVLKRYFRSFIFVPVISFAAFVLYSPAIQSMYISSEIFGLLFSLIALTCLLYIKNPFWKIGLATALFFIAGQMKDPFLFGIFAIFPVAAWEFFSHSSFLVKVKLFFSGVLGIAIPGTCLFTYLLLMGSLRSYVKVLNYKTQFRTGIDLIQFFFKSWQAYEYVQGILQRWFVATGILLFIYLLFKILFFIRKKVQFKIKSKVISASIKTATYTFTERYFITMGMVLYVFGNFLGMSLQGSFSTHYLIQGIVPLYLFLGIVCSSILLPISRGLEKVSGPLVAKTILFIVVIFLLLPKSYYLRSYSYYYHYGGFGEKPSPLILLSYLTKPAPVKNTVQDEVEQLIDARVPEGRCIMYVYGWHVASVYIYAKRPPCTRFFLPNIVGLDWQKEEYRKAILNNPPAALLYDTGGSDINWVKFEDEVINFSKIIKNCYVVDPKYINFNKVFPTTLFWPKYEGDELKACVQKAAEKIENPLPTVGGI